MALENSRSIHSSDSSLQQIPSTILANEVWKEQTLTALSAGASKAAGRSQLNEGLEFQKIAGYDDKSSSKSTLISFNDTVPKARAEQPPKEGGTEGKVPSPTKVPADLSTEFKLVGADHGKPTASRKADTWTIDDHADGTEIRTDSATGNRLTKLKDGTGIAELKGGNIVITRPDGTVLTKDATGQMQFVNPDGTGVIQWSDGRRDPIKRVEPKKDPYEDKEFKQHEDGSSVYETDYLKVTRKNGTQVEEFKEHNLKITTSPDGTKISAYKDGSKITEKPDGTKIVEWKDGYKMTTLKDGTQIFDDSKMSPKPAKR